jgi:thioredoxin 1
MNDLLEITDASFETLDPEVPILLDFSGAWCPPCRLIEPHLRAIASEYGERVVIGRVDADRNPKLIGAFAVHSLPTLIMMRQREVVGQLVGAAPKRRIQELIESALG